MKKPVKKFGSRMKEGGVVDKVKEAAKDYADVYSKSARELGETASEIGSSAIRKAKEVGSAVAKEARNYGRLYKEGLGMKPDTPYEKKNGGMVKAKTKNFPDLTGDGKVTRADVLKGRGVYKKGGSVPKGTHRMPDGSLMKNSEHKEQAMKKPVKKFGGGMMNSVIAAVKKAVAEKGGGKETNPGVISRPGMEIGLSKTSIATPQGDQQLTPEQRKQIIRRVMAAKMGRPMKKGGAVTKKSVKKTTRKK